MEVTDLSPTPTVAYPRGHASASDLKKIAAGMNKLIGGIVTFVVIAFLFASTKSQNPRPLHPSPEYIAAEMTVLYFCYVVLPTIISTIFIYLGLRSIGPVLGWKKQTSYLIPVGILLTTCMCGEMFFLIGIVVAVNRELARLGAPNWISLSPKKLINYANSLG